MNDVYDWLCLDATQFASRIKSTTARASGRGGQKINKSSSAIRLVFEPLGISVFCDKFRCLEDNRKRALRLLREELALQTIENPPDSILSRLESFFRNGLHIRTGNPEWPLLVATLCGSFQHFRGDHRPVASLLGISPTRLVRFVFEHKKLLERINAIRKEFDRCPLKR